MPSSHRQQERRRRSWSLGRLPCLRVLLSRKSDGFQTHPAPSGLLRSLPSASLVPSSAPEAFLSLSRQADVVRPTRIAQPDCSSEIASRLTVSGSSLSSRSLIYFCPFVAQRPLRLLSLSLSLARRRARDGERDGSSGCEGSREKQLWSRGASFLASCPRHLTLTHFPLLLLPSFFQIHLMRAREQDCARERERERKRKCDRNKGIQGRTRGRAVSAARAAASRWFHASLWERSEEDSLGIKGVKRSPTTKAHDSREMRDVIRRT